MRLVPETNAQKTSASRLDYKLFSGTMPARRKEGVAMSDSSLPLSAESEWAAFAATAQCRPL